MICYNCKGNGYVKLKFENEESIGQCKVCDSQVELKEDNYYHQSWTEGAEDSLSIYYGFTSYTQIGTIFGRSKNSVLGAAYRRKLKRGHQVVKDVKPKRRRHEKIIKYYDTHQRSW